MIRKQRKTRETDIELNLLVDGDQKTQIQTGLPFLDHMLEQLAFHGGWDLSIEARGDLEVDDHHLVEDTALVLGAALQETWRSRRGMHRYGQRILPMDETLILCAVDLGGRPFCKTKLGLKRERVGGIATEMFPHFFRSLAVAGAFTLHIRKLSGSNHHHMVEAAFKALGHAIREALSLRGGKNSTKGVL